MSEMNYAYEQRSTFQQPPQLVPKWKQLEPCPFCGSQAELAAYEGRDHPCSYVRCPSCKVATLSYFDEETAIGVWNRRASPCPSCGAPDLASGVQDVAEKPLDKAQIRDMERRRICSILKEQGFEVQDREDLPFGAA